MIHRHIQSAVSRQSQAFSRTFTPRQGNKMSTVAQEFRKSLVNLDPFSVVLPCGGKYRAYFLRRSFSGILRVWPGNATGLSNQAFGARVFTAVLTITIISIILKLYSPRYLVNITFSRHGRSARSYFSCVVYHF